MNQLKDTVHKLIDENIKLKEKIKRLEWWVKHAEKQHNEIMDVVQEYIEVDGEDHKQFALMSVFKIIDPPGYDILIDEGIDEGECGGLPPITPPSLRVFF